MDRIEHRSERTPPAYNQSEAPTGVRSAAAPKGAAATGAAKRPYPQQKAFGTSRRVRAATDVERQIIFNYCSIVLHARAGELEPAALRPAPRNNTPSRLSPRMRETMNHLLKGDSEKQIATRLRLSRHTVHCYIKQIYRRYNVSSRGELFADWVRRGGPLARYR